MSRTFVANDRRTVHVELHFDESDGFATAACEGCGWTTEPGRVDEPVDVLQEAGIHLDQEHQ